MQAARILVIKLSSLGDLFHALPAVHRLRLGLQAPVDWVTQPEYVDLVKCFTDVERVIAFPRRDFIRRAPGFLRELRRERYGHIIDLQGLLKSALVARLARGTERIGPSFHREGAGFAYTQVAGARDRQRHAVNEGMDVLRLLGLPDSPAEFPVRFPKAPIAEARPRVGVVPVSRWTTKNWPAASFASVARTLQSRARASLFLIGGSDSVDACAEITARLDRPPVNSAGRLSLVETGSLIAGLDLLIANDSGPMHMAAALGVPVLSVFGATDPRRTGPFGAGHEVVSLGLPCQPCMKKSCRFGDTRCLAGLEPERVATVALAMLARRSASPSAQSD